MSTSPSATLHPHCRLVAAVALLGACSRPPSAAPAPARVEQPTLRAADRAAAPPIHVRLLAFNDFHGALRPPAEQPLGSAQPVGGAGYLAAHLRRLGAGDPDSLVVAAGDLVGASQFPSAYFHDEPSIEVMNAIGLSVTTVGNHEFDHGVDELLRLRRGGCHPTDGCRFGSDFRGARFEVLAANVRERAGGNSPLPAWVVREVHGIPIAFVGLPFEQAPLSTAAPTKLAGYDFAGEIATVNALVPEIRRRGIEALVLLIHQGAKVTSKGLDECGGVHGKIVDIVEKLDPAFDVVVSGHTHALYNCRIAGRPVTSALSHGRAITTLDLSIDPATKDVVSVEAHNHWVTHDVAVDPTVGGLVDRALGATAALEKRTVGHLRETLSARPRDGGDSPLGSVVADAQLEATTKNGAELALVRANRVETDLVASEPGGAVTFGNLFAAQPYGNRLVTLTITGKDLVAILEHELKEESALQVSDGVAVHYRTESGRVRVAKLTLRGAPLAADAKIRLTVNENFAEKDPLLRAGATRVFGPGDVEALESYFTRHRTVAPPKLPRSTRSAD